MPRCSYKRRRHRKVCIGDLDTPIDIKKRGLTPAKPGAGGNYDVDFDTPQTVWALVETTRGTQLFDGTNLNNGITHKFLIQYLDSGVDRDDHIFYDNRTFNVLDVENWDERGEYLLISCNERGDKTKKVNEA